jgi:hypothetical protein
VARQQLRAHRRDDGRDPARSRGCARRHRSTSVVVGVDDLVRHLADVALVVFHPDVARPAAGSVPVSCCRVRPVGVLQHHQPFSDRPRRLAHVEVERRDITGGSRRRAPSRLSRQPRCRRAAPNPCSPALLQPPVRERRPAPLFRRLRRRRPPASNPQVQRRQAFTKRNRRRSPARGSRARGASEDGHSPSWSFLPESSGRVRHRSGQPDTGPGPRPAGASCPSALDQSSTRPTS